MANRIRLNPLGGGGAAAPGPKFGATPTMPSIDPVHMASRVGGGGLHSYLGHFSQPPILSAGHNTSGCVGAGPGDTKETGTFSGKSNKLGSGSGGAKGANYNYGKG